MNKWWLAGIAIIVIGILVWQYQAPTIQAPAISDLNQNKVEPGPIKITGYVIKQYTCPPCPAGAQCKACMGNNIVISETTKPFTDYTQLTDSDLIIYTDNPDKYSLGYQYTFELTLEGYDSQGSPIYELN